MHYSIKKSALHVITLTEFSSISDIVCQLEDMYLFLNDVHVDTAYIQYTWVKVPFISSYRIFTKPTRVFMEYTNGKFVQAAHAGHCSYIVMELCFSSIESLTLFLHYIYG